MGSTTVAIPASIAGKLAEAASDDVSRHLEEGRDATARSMAETADELIHAWSDGEGGKLVPVDSEHVSLAASTDKAVKNDTSQTARAFLENAGVWSGDE